MTLKTRLEARIGARFTRGWILDNPGPARFGWASIWPCKQRWEGRTLAEVADRLNGRDAAWSLP